MPSQNRVTVSLSADQVNFLEIVAAELSEAEQRRVTPGEVVRRALAVTYGERWPAADLEWGGYDRARPSRWKNLPSDVVEIEPNDE